MGVELLHDLTAASAGWQFLDVRVIAMETGDRFDVTHEDRESAVVLVSGGVRMESESASTEAHRSSPFASMGSMAYVPPRARLVIEAQEVTEIAIGSAPAVGKYPLQILEPREMPSELRGGGPAYRQVTSPLGPAVKAESLIVYEAYLPRGMWSGWPPHRHDGQLGSPYLEETYYYRFDRSSGFGNHRNFSPEDEYDEVITVADRSLVSVHRGYHVCGIAPAANAWILNFLAGSERDRVRSPVFDTNETWISEDWERGALALPAVVPDRNGV